MKIIFLDVEGVLNGGESFLEPKCLKNLQKLIKKTKAKIVITSNWRKTEAGREKLLKGLKEYDLAKEVVGWTPSLGRRKQEIHAYLLTLATPPQNFIIIDDVVEKMTEYLSFIIKVDGKVGLTEENVLEAIEKLELY